MNDLTMEQAAAILGVTRQTLYNWMERGAVPNGNMREIVLADIERRESEIEKIKRQLAAFTTEATPTASVIQQSRP